MDALLRFLVRHKYSVLIFFLILTAVSLCLFPLTKTNYDLAEYLPAKSMTKRAIDTMDAEFGYPGTAQVMVENVTIAQARALKEKIEAVDGVKSVLWLDDVADTYRPETAINASLLKNYYKDGAALYTVQFEGKDYALETGESLREIRRVLGDGVSITGTAESAQNMRQVVSGEMLKIAVIVVPICVLILMFAAFSWVEPFFYLSVMGISVAINMGTNWMFDSVSFITKSMAGVLQLAISLDYSLFLLHRYTEERDNGAEVVPAVIEATKKSLSSIAASALTTVAGFAALLFMRYSIGTDIGLVLAKGIVISFACVILLLPVLIVLFHGIIDKTRHKPFLPSFAKFGGVIIKGRFFIAVVLLLVLVPSFLAQRNNAFLYGDTSGSSSQGEIAVEKQKIEDRFGVYNPVILLVPAGEVSREKALAEELAADPGVRDVQALVTLADPAIPREMVPEAVRSQFQSKEYSRIVLNLSFSGESAETFATVDAIKAAAEKYYPGKWLAAGTATSIADIKETVERDSLTVNLFSILAVGLIVLFTFRSLSIPVLLLAVIQTSIWINMSVPYFLDAGLVFIGYLVVSSIQLGATIDYAILMSNRYMEVRRERPPKEAALFAVGTAGSSVLVSALILSVAGFSEGLLSKIPSVSEIGTLLGRGASLSGLLVLILLPGLLVIFDKLIMVSTLGTKDVRQGEKL